MDYHILSGHTQGDVCLWWKPDDRGYTSLLDLAGIYPEEKVEANPGYYNNGVETWAIPVDEARRLSKRVVHSDLFFAKRKESEQWRIAVGA